jgi:ribonucleoside-diphosphate reductase alpha chain
MGWADMLSRLEIAYNSNEAYDLAEKIGEFIEKIGIKQSQILAKERGEFPNWEGSRWQKKGFLPMRNATITTIAPTGSIAMIAGCSYGIEPHFALAYYKQALGGYKLPEINEDLVRKLEKEGMNTGEIVEQIMEEGTIQEMANIPDKIKKIFVTAHDLRPEEHIKMQSAWQRYTDNAVSKTINLPFWATVDDVAEAYMRAWSLKCKGVTVYRDSSRSEQVLNIGRKEGKSRKQLIVKKEKVERKNKVNEKEICPQCGGKLELHEGCKTCPNCAFSACSL